MHRFFSLARKLTLTIIIAAFTLSATSVFAQLSTVWSFGDQGSGVSPFGTPATDGTYLYGTTAGGGANGSGVIYKMKADGTSFDILHDFGGSGDGATGYGRLLYSGGVLYGTTHNGGANNNGTIFKINADGTGYQLMYSFSFFTDGGSPYGGLTLVGSFLYGMTNGGGTSSNGTLYRIQTDGTNFLKMVDFNGAVAAFPQGDLFYDNVNDMLYGFGVQGGSFNNGTIFKIKPNGTGYALVYGGFNSTVGKFPIGSPYFDGTYIWGTTLQGGSSNNGVLFRIDPTDVATYTYWDMQTSGVGTSPMCTLISDGTSLYGSTPNGGSSGGGAVFKFQAGTFTKLYDLDNSFVSQPQGTLTMIGSTLYGANGTGGTSHTGNIYKVNTDGSNGASIISLITQGNSPRSPLVFDGTYLYGTTNSGGAYNDGTIYRITPDATVFEVLFDFQRTVSGKTPMGSIFYHSGALYGMTQEGGANDVGTVYKIQSDGSGFTKLLDFDDATDGMNPQGGFAFDGTFLYGMTYQGSGSSVYGTIFKISTVGTGYTKLFEFDSDNTGANPSGDLIYDGTYLYGMAEGGGANDYGTAFRVKTDGTGFETLLSFDYTATGAHPTGTFYTDGTYLYGTTNSGGSHFSGTIFRMKKDGSGFQLMHEFTGSTDGSAPGGALISEGGYLYGIVPFGGVYTKGLIYKIKPDGTAFTFVSFMEDGYDGESSLYSDGTFLYGVTVRGGTYDNGTLFKRSLAPFTKITSLYPDRGVVGTYVNIMGTDFDPLAANNQVKFNGVLAKVVSATENNIVAIVPAGATDGPISVKTPSNTAVSDDDFNVDDGITMFNGIVKTCDAILYASFDDYDVTTTLVPDTPGNKIRVTFTSATIDDDLVIYNGPDASSPVLIDTRNGDHPGIVTSSAPSGELTLEWIWEDEGTTWDATVDCVLASTVITIDQQPANTAGCENSVTFLTTKASGPSGITYQWQFSDDGNSWNDLDDDDVYSGTDASDLGVSMTDSEGAGLYRCRVNAPGASEAISNAVVLADVGVAPDAPTTQSASPACGPASVKLTAAGGNDGEYAWFTSATGGTPINNESNSTYSTPVISATTIYYVALTDGSCYSNRTEAVANIRTCSPPSIAATEATGFVGGIVIIEINGLITDPDNDLDLSTLTIESQPQSGAIATLDGTVLTINYSGSAFAGTDVMSIRVCDTSGLCTTQQLHIEIAGDIVVYNAVSPNGDNKNDFFMLEFIDILPGTKDNVVRIFNRWGDEVFSVSNYNNADRVFNGVNKNGNKLPSGVYYYKISFTSGGDDRTGYLELKY